MTDELPPYRLRFTKQQSQMQTSGYYPHTDTILAVVEVPSNGLLDEYHFPFVREGTVASALDPDHPFHDILAENGIDVDLDVNPVFGKGVTTFSGAGVSRRDSVDNRIAET